MRLYAHRLRFACDEANPDALCHCRCDTDGALECGVALLFVCAIAFCVALSLGLVLGLGILVDLEPRYPSFARIHGESCPHWDAEKCGSWLFACFGNGVVLIVAALWLFCVWCALGEVRTAWTHGPLFSPTNPWHVARWRAPDEPTDDDAFIHCCCCAMRNTSCLAATPLFMALVGGVALTFFILWCYATSALGGGVALALRLQNRTGCDAAEWSHATSLCRLGGGTPDCMATGTMTLMIIFATGLLFVGTVACVARCRVAVKTGEEVALLETVHRGRQGQG